MSKLLLLLWLPIAAFGSVVYSFSEPTAQGTTGFTYTTSDYLSGPSVLIPSPSFTSCDISGLPGWSCSSAILRESRLPNGQSTVAVAFNLVDQNTTGFGSTDQINESFPGAALSKNGSWTAFLSSANLSIQNMPGEGTAAPEPGSWALLMLGGLPGVFTHYRRKTKCR